ncbi:class I SAM-dependent methyltransferase [Cellulomonas sp.]|uniref:class I SAM-dependent methyltransferase n=1 Tax=Cellulomonas sp. TaxID=40001 RepID=UPI003BAD1927
MSGSRAAYWDDQAATYDRTTAFLEPRLFAPARRWIADRVSGRTLEVGVGTGANLTYYADRVTDLTLTDVSAAMLQAASVRARAVGVRARLVQADSAHLDLPDDAFDTVVSTLALCCVDDELAVLRELARVLRPGGLLLMADHVESSARLGRAVQGVLERVTPRHAGEHYRRRPLLLLEPAGLELVESAASRWRLVERLSAKVVGS